MSTGWCRVSHVLPTLLHHLPSLPLHPVRHQPARLPLCSCSLSVLSQLILVVTATRFDRHICTAASLCHPAAHRGIHRIYRAAASTACLTPLPLSVALAEPGAAVECTTLLAWVQLCLGLLAPLLWQAVTEARAFQEHKQERRQAGLPPKDTGALAAAEAAVYDFVHAIALEYNVITLTVIYWMLASVCFDFCAVFAVPAHLRRLAGDPTTDTLIP